VKLKMKEGKQAVKMTLLSCPRFRSTEVRLWLSVMAYYQRCEQQPPAQSIPHTGRRFLFGLQRAQILHREAIGPGAYLQANHIISF
jgi:hypothetical protein